MAEIITPDLCVIGAGLGGLTAAAEARALGASVVLVERDRMGGDYLNTGTIPSKALSAAAAHAQSMRAGLAFGFAPAEDPKANPRKVHDALHQVIASIAPSDAVARIEALGVQVIKADARFIDPRTIAAGDVHVKARRFIIATGARSVPPSVPGIEGVPFFTTETIFDNTRRLTHLVILGAGPIGLELAQSFNRLGTQVSVVEPRAPLSAADPELAAIALQRMREEGVAIYADTQVVAVQPRSQGIGVMIRSADEESLLDVSHILVASGRAPNVEPLDLGKAGIKRDKEDGSRLQLSPGLRTSNSRVYAIGDAAGGPQRAHLAAWHARLVVRNALLALPIRTDTGLVPIVHFTDPEIAEVGLSEADARSKHGNGVRVLRAGFADNDRAKATRQAYGLAKLVVAGDGRVLGAGIVGDRAGELISTLALAIAHKLTANDLAAFVAPYATLSEIVTALGREYQRGLPVSPMLQRLASFVRFLP